ncbi:class A beta-lactamase-related serine hydrolase, partial [Mesorhizobium sp. M5C.F.Ca.IN.020.29.1.1]
MAGARETQIHGHVSKGFEPVMDAFRDNFVSRGELGGACCIYLHGEKVVDVWGGVRNKGTGGPWLEDTMVLVHSATKGFAAMTLALAHSRGWLDYDERVATYWPEFAANGKADITVRQLLAHQAGLFAFEATVDKVVVADLDRLAHVLANEKPAYPAGVRQAYHALSLGFYQGELLRRIDPRHRSLGQFFQDEIATPLGADFYILLPETIPNSRLAHLTQAGMLKMIFSMPFPMTLAIFNRKSEIYRALLTNPGAGIVIDERTVYARNLEVPSGGGVGNARGMARVYSAFASGGAELGLRRVTLEALKAPALPSANGFYDDGIRAEAQFSLGFMKSSREWPVGSPSAFGAPGAGGSLAFADPETGIAFAYVTNRMSAKMLSS